MPRTPKYPLTALREQRDRYVETATAGLADAIRARETAEEAKRAAEGDREKAEARVQEVRNDEANRLARGELRVADLSHAQAWEQGARAEIHDLGNAVEQAERHLQAMREAERAARALLAQRKADLDVVLKDQTRFDDETRRASDAVDEEISEEVFVAQRIVNAGEG